MLKKSMVLSFLSLCTSFISALSQILFAKLFGSSGEFNSYLIASSIPFFISGTIVVAFNYSLTPLLVKNNAQPDNTSSSVSLNITTFAFGISLVGYVLSCFYYFVVLDTSADNIFILNLSLSYLFCFLQILIGYLKCLAESLFLFIVPFIASSFYNISVIISCLMFSESIGTPSIISGYILGTVIGLVIIIAYINKTKPGIFSFSLDSNKEILSYLRSLPLVLVAMLTFTVFAAIDLVWVPSLGSSKLAYVNYCQKIVGNVGVLIIAGPAAILTPYLTKQLAESTREIFLNSIVKSLRLALVISTLSIIFMVNYTHSITKLLLERGNFTDLDTTAVSSILPFFGLAIIPTICVVIIFRALMVTGSIMSTAKIGLVSALSYFIFSGVLKVPMDVQGIGMSYLVSWLITLGFSVKLLWGKDVKNLISRPNILFLSKLFTICIIYQLFLSEICKFWAVPEDKSILSLVLYLFVNFGMAVVFFVILLAIFRFEEISFIQKKIPFIKKKSGAIPPLT